MLKKMRRPNPPCKVQKAGIRNNVDNPKNTASKRKCSEDDPNYSEDPVAKRRARNSLAQLKRDF